MFIDIQVSLPNEFLDVVVRALPIVFLLDIRRRFSDCSPQLEIWVVANTSSLEEIFDSNDRPVPFVRLVAF